MPYQISGLEKNVVEPGTFRGLSDVTNLGGTQVSEMNSEFHFSSGQLGWLANFLSDYSHSHTGMDEETGVVCSIRPRQNRRNFLQGRLSRGFGPEL